MGRRTGTLGLFSRAITQQPYGSTAIHQTRLPVSGWPWTGLDIASAPVVHVGEEGGRPKGRPGYGDSPTTAPPGRDVERRGAITPPPHFWDKPAKKRAKKNTCALLTRTDGVRFSCGGADAPWTRHTPRLLSRHPLPRPRSRRPSLAVSVGLVSILGGKR